MNAVQKMILTLILLVPVSTSFAGSMQHGQHGAGYMGRQMEQLAPEKQEQLRAIMDAHRKEVRPLQNALWQKRMELDALAPNPNTKPGDIKALVAEMANLRSQLQEKQDAVRAKVRQDVGVDMPMMGRGAGDGGRHGRGGKGMGQGMNGMGCWGMNEDAPVDTPKL